MPGKKAKKKVAKRTPKKTAPRKPRGKEIPFDFSTEEQLTRPIRVKSYKAFDVTFRTPDGMSNLRMVTGAAAAGGGDEAGAEAMLGDCLRHMVSWTLKPEISRESLLALAKADVEILTAIYKEIRTAGQSAKN